MSLVERLIPPPSLADRREALHRAGGWLSEMGGGGVLQMGNAVPSWAGA